MKNTFLTLMIAAGTVFPVAVAAQYREPEKKDKQEVFYPQVSFDSLQAKKMLARGSATIKGVAFTKQKNGWGIKPLLGDRILANQIRVVLLPVTPYFNAWYQLRKEKENTRKRRYVYLSNDAYRYRLEAITNSSGEFTFPEMKPGTYFLQGFLPYTENKYYHEYTGTASDGYNRTNYYDLKQYSVNHEDRIEAFVEVKENGEIVKVKLH
ncbi:MULTISPECIES: carboxypeptidase-like regulatory domain-containing protein [Chryseobacterium]|uniref:Carboxypeptidase regulatory-like domain-containing protein n=1 Tax=Chryseobacterium camelliae TaxID=1265445 RepID=A0ABU0TI85_9FLAO|nr:MULTISPECIES: carboxypeptidase-like regulatory domain-containing protein [Chryseobacterium]MDT3409376.1 hypothetical protein [Pseudacidovorax intermedius]MDQ1096759.1 hypothetical protein [Chryseobacterium camelliae]MDQ1100702.1 hypothetical protein [Chryseobacterium sp. SORGH_AS_1048]MDR6088041.1 hypothetical protein [Chryseobacterium sp. SORGH_AS_0909]MDR6132415.1 hypothetical protein [Chryseobacterium sp. SORGH_AS_1175]